MGTDLPLSACIFVDIILVVTNEIHTSPGVQIKSVYVEVDSLTTEISANPGGITVSTLMSFTRVMQHYPPRQHTTAGVPGLCANGVRTAEIGERDIS